MEDPRFFAIAKPQLITMAELHVQSEKAFQKQHKIFLGNKLDLLKKKFSTLSEDEKKQIRYWRTVGLGFTTPTEAIEGDYVDNKCPFTGDVAIRGRILCEGSTSRQLPVS